MNTEIQQALMDWNPWGSGKGFPQELLGIKREYDLTPYLKIPEIKIIEGARRVGKSTLLYEVIHHLLQKNAQILYINFEDEILKKYPLSEIVYEYLQSSSIDYLFVDEIQSCIDWVQFLRKIYDRREIKQIWLSGSNASLIKSEYATLLTGRNFPVHIFPLSFREFLYFKSLSVPSLPISKKEQAKVLGFFSEYLEFGAFPAVATREVFKKEILLAYFDDFIYKDIVSRHHVNATKIKELAVYLATQSSKLFSYRKIAVALKIHLNTVMDYFNYLKEAFLFEELYKYDFSLKKQIAHDKKVYCLDTGLASCVSFKFSEDKGRILENIIFCELRRRKHEIYFHKHNHECDFILKKGLDITEAIQVCVTLDDLETKKREINGLMEAMQIYQLTEGLILTCSEEGLEFFVENNKQYSIKIVPVWKWLLET